MSNWMFYLAIVFVFCILPAAFILGLKAAASTVMRAPRHAEGFGINVSPFVARLAMTGLIFVPLALLSPGLALKVSVIAAILLPPAIVLILLFALFRAWVDADGDFGGTFWRIANPVPFLCVAFAISLLPISIIRYQAAQTVVQSTAR